MKRNVDLSHLLGEGFPLLVEADPCHHLLPRMLFFFVEEEEHHDVRLEEAIK